MAEAEFAPKLPAAELVLPVLNEVAILEASVAKLTAFCRAELQAYDWTVLIADNGSSDGTEDLAQRLAASDSRVRAFHIPERGRGRALRKAWLESKADLLCYMDIDLSTGLEAVPPLLHGLASGYDLATGTRHAHASKRTRSLKREVLSRGYNLLVRTTLGTRLSDLQCGFKGITRKAALELLPQVENQHWFFDTELFTLAERAGYRILEVPVAWVEDPDSRVRILSTIAEDLAGMARLRMGYARKLRALRQKR